MEAVMFGLKRQKLRAPLDRVLLNWTPSDPLTVRGLLNGGIAVFGRSGSGKTSSSGKVIGRSIIACPNSGGLILSAKPEDGHMWQSIFAECRRLNDLIVFGPLPRNKWR